MSTIHKFGALTAAVLGLFASLHASQAEAGIFDPPPVYTGAYPVYYNPQVVAYRPLLGRRVVAYAPTAYVAPTVVGYAPAYAAPAVVNYGPAYSAPTVVNYAPAYSAPAVVNYAPAYPSPSVVNYAPAYSAPTVVNYPGTTVYYGARVATPVPAVSYPLPSLVYPPAVFP